MREKEKRKRACISHRLAFFFSRFAARRASRRAMRKLSLSPSRYRRRWRLCAPAPDVLSEPLNRKWNMRPRFRRPIGQRTECRSTEWSVLTVVFKAPSHRASFSQTLYFFHFNDRSFRDCCNVEWRHVAPFYLSSICWRAYRLYFDFHRLRKIVTIVEEEEEEETLRLLATFGRFLSFFASTSFVLSRVMYESIPYL